jgi:hypothetical protein
MIHCILKFYEHFNIRSTFQRKYDVLFKRPVNYRKRKNRVSSKCCQLDLKSNVSVICETEYDPKILTNFICVEFPVTAKENFFYFC